MIRANPRFSSSKSEVGGRSSWPKLCGIRSRVSKEVSHRDAFNVIQTLTPIFPISRSSLAVEAQIVAFLEDYLKMYFQWAQDLKFKKFCGLEGVQLVNAKASTHEGRFDQVEIQGIGPTGTYCYHSEFLVQRMPFSIQLNELEGM